MLSKVEYFQWKQGKGLKILATKKMLQILSIALAQLRHLKFYLLKSSKANFFIQKINYWKGI